MGGIDTRTMFWAIGIEEFCSTLMFLWVWRQDRANQWLWWAGASLLRTLHGLTYWLIVLEIFGEWKWPVQFLSIWLVMLSGPVSMVALTKTLKIRPPTAWEVAPVFLIVLAHFLVSWFKLDPTLRVGIQSLALAYSMGWMTWAAWSATHKNREQEIIPGLILTFGAWSFLQLSRACVTIFFTPSALPSSFAASSVNSWYYIVYQFIAMALPVVLLSARNHSLLSQLDKARQEAVARADTDGLTGLLNHRAVMDQGRAVLQSTHGRGLPVAALMVDCDNFKRFNDEFGHQVGDAVLMAISDVMRKTNWPGCRVGRYGGEEFLIILPEADEAAAIVVVRHLMRDLKNQSTERITALASVTVSVGIAVSTDVKEENLVGLIHRADIALLKAKADGRNRFEIARPFEAECAGA